MPLRGPLFHLVLADAQLLGRPPVCVCMGGGGRGMMAVIGPAPCMDMDRVRPHS